MRHARYDRARGCYLYLCLILAKPANGVIPDLLSGKYIDCCNTQV